LKIECLGLTKPRVFTSGGQYRDARRNHARLKVNRHQQLFGGTFETEPPNGQPRASVGDVEYPIGRLPFAGHVAAHTHVLRRLPRE
jgi:hypothetical protein